MIQNRVLLGHPRIEVLRSLEPHFCAGGFSLLTASDVSGIRQKLLRQPHLLVLSNELPGALSLTAELWERQRLGTIVLGSGDDLNQMVSAFNHGALDYLVWPGRTHELMARTRRCLRLVRDLQPPEDATGLRLNLAEQTAYVRGSLIRLTPLETELLGILARRPGQVVTAATLLDQGWALGEDVGPASLWVCIRRLREKLEADPRNPLFLQTVRNVGYRLMLESPAGTASRAA